MIGSTFKANKDFFANIVLNKKDETTYNGRTKIKKGTVIIVLDVKICKGKKFLFLDHNIGWISNNNKLWNKLDLLNTIQIS